MDDETVCEEAIRLTGNGMLLLAFSDRVRGLRPVVESATRSTPESLQFAKGEVWLVDSSSLQSVHAANDFLVAILSHGCDKKGVPTENWDLLWSQADCAKYVKVLRELWCEIPLHVKKAFPTCEAYQCCICYTLPPTVYMCTREGCGYICEACSTRLSVSPQPPRCPSCNNHQQAYQRTHGGHRFYGVRNRAAEDLINLELNQATSSKRQRRH